MMIFQNVKIKVTQIRSSAKGHFMASLRIKWKKLVIYVSTINILKSQTLSRERSGSVVECLTRDQRAAGSNLTSVTALWSLSKTHVS